MSPTRLAVAALWLAAVTPAAGATLHARVAAPDGKPVADAAVVLEALEGNAAVVPIRGSIEQHDREFIPYVTIVPVGSTIEFPNRDPFKHHVYSFSPAKVFEIKLYAGKPARPQLFDKPGEVALGCNIHDWMEAYVLVVNSNYYAKSGPDGGALIDDVPPGTYRLKLWHPRQTGAPKDRTITITGAPATVSLVLPVAPRIVRPKPPVDEDY